MRHPKSWIVVAAAFVTALSIANPGFSCGSSDCQYDAPEMIEIPAAGGDFTFHVNATESGCCRWKPVEHESWISISYPTHWKKGNRTVQFHVSANESGEERTGAIKIKRKNAGVQRVVWISQAAEMVQPDCTFEVSDLSFTADGGEATITASEGCTSWTAGAGGVGWIHLTSDQESGGPTGFIVDPSCDDDVRTAQLTITEDLGQGSGEVFSDTVTQSSPITPGNALTTSAAALYVSNPECQLIYEVTSNGTSNVATVLTSDDTRYNGIEYGPDGLLYGSDPVSGSSNGLYQIQLGGQNTEMLIYSDGSFEPANARFNSDGDLIVADLTGGLLQFQNEKDLIAEGIQISSSDFSPVANSGMFGSFVDLTTAPNGDLLALAGSGSVIRFPYLAESQSYGNGGEFISGFADPRAITRTSNGKIVVADGGTLIRYRADGSSLGGCESFTGATVYGLEASADDYLYATVVDASGDGKLYEIPFDPASSTCGSPSPIATVNGVEGDPPPLAGVAVAFAGQEGDPFSGDFAAGTQAFTFGEQVYEFRAIGDDGSPCVVALSSEEVNATFLDGLLDAAGIDATPIVYEGENARAILFQYTEVGGCTGNEQIDADEHGINAYFAATNPRVVLCHGSLEAADCELTDSLGSSAFGFLPDDGRTSGRGTGRFSYSFLVDKANFVNGEPVYDGTFCGPYPPLAFTSIEHPRKLFPYTILPVAFNVTEKSCRRGPWVEDLTVVLGVNRLPLNGYTFRSIPFEELVFFGLTPTEPDRAVFRPLRFPWWGYQLNLKLRYADGTPFEPGAVFELTFTDESGLFFPVETAYIQIIACDHDFCGDDDD